MLNETEYPTLFDASSHTPVVIPQPSVSPDFDRVPIWGLPLARLTYDGALDEVDRLIAAGEPGFFITANLHYAMLSDRDVRLRELNRRAAFITADGMPMVWYSRLLRNPLPERVTGADLIWRLAGRACERGHSIYLLGGADGVADAARAEFLRRHPGLNVVGTEAPMMDCLSPREHQALIDRIRLARPDILLAALGQPKGELWLDAHRESLGVPVCVQLGASFDFVAGRVARAPDWVQRLGAEWLYRITREPRRMVPRYTANALFLLKAMLRDAVGRIS